MLVDLWFKGKHTVVVSKLEPQARVQLEYLSRLLQEKEETIESKLAAVGS